MTEKPRRGEFPVDRPKDMDKAAPKILLRTMRAGRSTPMKRHDYRVEVGNIGMVYAGRSTKKALKVFADYVEAAKKGAPDGHAGRASGEDVTLLRDDDIWKEHVGFLSRGEEDM